MQAVIKPKDNYAEDRLEQNRDIWIPIRSCNSLRDFSEPRWSEMNLSPPPPPPRIEMRRPHMFEFEHE